MSEVSDTSVFRKEERISVTSQKGDCVPLIILPETQISIKIGEAVSETKRAYGETGTVALVISLCAQKLCGPKHVPLFTNNCGN